VTDNFSASYAYPRAADDSLRFAQEVWLVHAMHENARLCRENAMLRNGYHQQTMVPPGLDALPPLADCSQGIWTESQEDDVCPLPPGLESLRPLAVQSDRLWAMDPKVVSLPTDEKDGDGSYNIFDRSTVASSSPRPSLGSLVSSSTHSRVNSIVDVNPFGSASNGLLLPTSSESATEVEPHMHRTTVMMKNLPNDYSRDMLIELLIGQGYAGCFDLVYLPIDFESKSGLGYAFINFAMPEAAVNFQLQFTGFKDWCLASDKVCEVTWGNTLQGLQAHIERYRNSPVMHESVPDYYRPALFCGSERVPFPPPTKKIRAPRHWHRRH
jgi:hypothetical protein